MSKVLFAGMLAGALMVPQAGRSAASPDGFRLPPIPYAETIQWLTGNAPGQKPRPYLGLLLTPTSAVAPVAFAAVPDPSRALLSSRFVADATVSTE